MRLCRYRLQYYRTNQTCSHNWNNIKICSIQQAETDKELLYTESWYFETHADWHACWALSLHELLY